MSQSIAVVGCGYWGKNLVRNFAQLGSLSWICDQDEAALKKHAEMYPNVRTGMRFDEVLTSPEVKAIVLATPASAHYSQAKTALQNGKDVFVEKPIALRYEHGAELVALAKANGCILMVGHILEYHPAAAMLRGLIRSGELGKIRYVYSNRLNLGKVRTVENILWSFAPHDISLISGLLEAEPLAVSAIGGSYLQTGVEDVTMTNLVFEDGVRAHIFVSWLHPFKEQKLVVVGDQKMAVFNDTVQDGKLKIYDKGIEWQGDVPVPRQRSETNLFFDDSEPLRLECQHFLDCIRERKQPLTDGPSALRVLKILQASQMSLQRGGATVQLAEVMEKAA